MKLYKKNIPSVVLYILDILQKFDVFCEDVGVSLEVTGVVCEELLFDVLCVKIGVIRGEGETALVL